MPIADDQGSGCDLVRGENTGAMNIASYNVSNQYSTNSKDDYLQPSSCKSKRRRNNSVSVITDRTTRDRHPSSNFRKSGDDSIYNN
jgi:hypothetical protein